MINKHITVHSLRHTHASLLAESGAASEQIQQRLGHLNDDITKQVYLHVTKAPNFVCGKTVKCYFLI